MLGRAVCFAVENPAHFLSHRSSGPDRHLQSVLPKIKESLFSSVSRLPEGFAVLRYARDYANRTSYNPDTVAELDRWARRCAGKNFDLAAFDGIVSATPSEDVDMWEDFVRSASEALHHLDWMNDDPQIAAETPEFPLPPVDRLLAIALRNAEISRLMSDASAERANRRTDAFFRASADGPSLPPPDYPHAPGYFAIDILGRIPAAPETRQLAEAGAFPQR